MIAITLYALEFSTDLRFFHVGLLEEILRLNEESYKTRQPSDWIILGVFASKDEAKEFYKILDPQGSCSISSDFRALPRMSLGKNPSPRVSEWMKDSVTDPCA